MPTDYIRDALGLGVQSQAPDAEAADVRRDEESEFTKSMDKLPTLNEGDVVSVDTAFLGGYCYVGGATLLDGTSDRADQHLRHADSRLSSPSPSVEDRLDAMMALKRAVDSRVKYIVRSYGLRSAPGFRPNQSKFEILQAIGIMRPTMSKELYDLRAAMEHDEAEPPLLSECIRFAEFVFYFIRATNWLVEKATSNLQFYLSDELDDEVGVSRRPPDWEFTIRGRFSLDDFNGDEPNSEMVNIRLTAEPQVRGEFLHIRGVVIGPESVLTELLKAFMTYQ